MASNLDLSATLQLIDEISAPLRAITKQSETLSKAFDHATRNVEQFNNTLNQVNRSSLGRVNQPLERTNSILVRSRSLVKGLATDFKLVLNGISDVQRKTQGLATSLAASRQQMRQQAISSAMKLGTVAMIASVPIKATIDFESSMADVNKVVDFGNDPAIAAAGLKTMSDEIIKLSTIYPMAAKDIATIVAAGGQSGIAKNELIAFGQDAIKMGVAFDTSAEDAGQSMAELRTAFRMTQPEVVDLADKINYLSNNTPAAAKGVMDIVQRIGPLGEVGGFASGSIAALGATLRGMSIQEDVAATSIKNMMLALIAGESATKSQQKAYQSLGLDSAQIAKDMQTDAEGTTLKVLEAVSKLEKHKQGALLKDLFGSESLSGIAPLLTNMDALRNNLDMVAESTKYAGSMNAEYEARSATTANQIQLLKNNLTAVGITLGNMLLPHLNKLIEYVIQVSQKVKAWIDANPELVKTIASLALKFIKLNAALFAIKYSALLVLGTFFSMLAGFIKFGAVMMLTNAILAKFGITFWGKFRLMGQALLWFSKLFARSFWFLAKQSIPWVITAIRAMSVALVTTPIGWAIMGIALAALLIIKYWQPVKAFFIGMWDGFMQALMPLQATLSSLKVMLAQIFAPLKPVLDMIIWALQSLAAAFMWLLTPAQSTQTQLNSATEAGRIFGAILGTIVSLIGQVVAGLVGALALGLQTIGTAIGTFAAMVVVHGGQALAYVAGLPSRFMAFLASLPASMATMGGQIMDGLKNGIMSKANAVVESILNVAGRVKAAFTGVRGIDSHSPSRVFTRYGDYMMQGLNQGLLANNAPIDAMLKTSDQLRGAMDTSAITFDKRRPIVAANDGRFGSSQGNQAPAPITINIYTQPHQNEQQIAQLVAQQIQKAQLGQTNQNTALYDHAEGF